jgi:ribonuclease HI
VVITEDDVGSLGSRQTAYGAEVEAIKAALSWYKTSSYRHMMVIHSHSTSAMAQTNHSGAGPGQSRAKEIRKIVIRMILEEGRSAQVQ